MNEALQLAIFNMVAKVGIDTAVAIVDGMKDATTANDALKALQAAQRVSWKEFKKEVQS